MALPENKPDLHEEMAAPAPRVEERRAEPRRAGPVRDASHSPARALQARLAEEMILGSPAPLRRITVAILVIAMACSFAALVLFGYAGALSA